MSEERRGLYGRRVTNQGANVHAWAEKTGEGSTDYDLCQRHAEILDRLPHAYDRDLIPLGDGEPQGEDGWGGDVWHPPYSDTLDGETTCKICDVTLLDEGE